MAARPPTADEIPARDTVLAALRPLADQLGVEGLMAAVAYTLGQIVAMQDQRKIVPEEAMDLILRNIQQGNRDVIARLLNALEGHA